MKIYHFLILITLLMMSCGRLLDKSQLTNQNMTSQKYDYSENSLQTTELIKMAYHVVKNESQSLKPACNIFIARVLELMGFDVKEGFLANDFDLYAKKYFKNYKIKNIKTHDQLRKFMWSYPERTGFILQWKRSQASGHLAIAERINEKIYVYQASLNKYQARINEMTIEKLLLVNHNKGLNIFTEITH